MTDEMSDNDSAPAATEPHRAARIVMRGTERSWTCTIEGARDLSERIGLDLFAAFLKCFEGAERLLGLEHLMSCNLKAVGSDSLAYGRNLRILVNLIGSTMYEVGDALQQLCSARVVDKMNDRALWEPLNALRKRWRSDTRLKTLRNTFGFHLGDPQVYQRGLTARLQEADEHVFERGEGTRRHGGEAALPVDCLLSGVGVNAVWLNEVIKLTREAHTTYPDLLHAVWKEVLTAADVELANE